MTCPFFSKRENLLVNFSRQPPAASQPGQPAWPASQASTILKYTDCLYTITGGLDLVAWCLVRDFMPFNSHSKRDPNIVKRDLGNASRVRRDVVLFRSINDSPAEKAVHLSDAVFDPSLCFTPDIECYRTQRQGAKVRFVRSLTAQIRASFFEAKKR